MFLTLGIVIQGQIVSIYFDKHSTFFGYMVVKF